MAGVSVSPKFVLIAHGRDYVCATAHIGAVGFVRSRNKIWLKILLVIMKRYPNFNHVLNSMCNKKCTLHNQPMKYKIGWFEVATCQSEAEIHSFWTFVLWL